MTSLLFTGSKHASLYSKYRPSYPKKLVEVIVQFLDKDKKSCVGQFDHAVDVGCGSGQFTGLLAGHFKKVLALDVSESQITEARQNNVHESIDYRVSPAENIPVEPETVDLVTVGQALHWFDLDRFYKEVHRVLRSGGVLAAFTYDNPKIHFKDCSKDLNKILFDQFFQHLFDTGSWNKGRLDVENKYENFTLPYADSVRDASVKIQRDLPVDDFFGYLSSWSGYQSYIKNYPHDKDLLDRMKQNMLSIVRKDAGEDVIFHVTHDITILMGRKP